MAITGNAAALLKLRAQIEGAPKDGTSNPFGEGVYQDVNGIPFEVAVKRAKSREGMEEPVPRPEKTQEKLPWARRSRNGDQGTEQYIS
jgi:hypothetical protein